MGVLLGEMGGGVQWFAKNRRPARYVGAREKRKSSGIE
jgi:hypothetical protein